MYCTLSMYVKLKNIHLKSCTNFMGILFKSLNSYLLPFYTHMDTNYNANSSDTSSCKNMNLRLFSKCVIWIIIWIAHFELRSVHLYTRETKFWILHSSGRRMSGYPTNQTCTELAFPVLLYASSTRYIGGSG